MADAKDSKSFARKGVWVQVPPPVFKQSRVKIDFLIPCITDHLIGSHQGVRQNVRQTVPVCRLPERGHISATSFR